MAKKDEKRGPLLSAAEAAHLLGIKLPTLYAYVSRGQVRSQPGDDPRSRLYLREDVERLLSRRELRRNPKKVVAKALDWGVPVLESGLTLIADGTFYYRGLEAPSLARQATLEEVAGLLWFGRRSAGAELFDGRVQPLSPDQRVTLEPLAMAPAGVAFQALLAHAQSEDAAAADLRSERVASCGARIVGLLIACAARLERASSGGLARSAVRRLAAGSSGGRASDQRRSGSVRRSRAQHLDLHQPLCRFCRLDALRLGHCRTLSAPWLSSRWQLEPRRGAVRRARHRSRRARAVRSPVLAPRCLSTPRAR